MHMSASLNGLYQLRIEALRWPPLILKTKPYEIEVTFVLTPAKESLSWVLTLAESLSLRN